MAGFGRCFKAAAAGILVVTVAVTVVEMEIFYSYGGNGGYGNGGTRARLQRSDDIMINPAARLPNEGRLKKKKNGGKSSLAMPGVRGQAGFGLTYNSLGGMTECLTGQCRAADRLGCMYEGGHRTTMEFVFLVLCWMLLWCGTSLRAH